MVAASNDPLLLVVGTERARRTLRASKVVQTYAAGDARVAQWLSAPSRDKVFFQLFLIGSKFLQCVLVKKKAATKNRHSQAVPKTTEALLLFYGSGCVNSCLQNCRPYAKLHRKTLSLSRVAF